MRRGILCSGSLVLMLAVPVSAQQLSGPAAPLAVPQSLNSLLATGNRSDFSGSVPSARLQPGVLNLSVEDAIDRGLRYNLGAVLSSEDTAAARAYQLKQLSDILPKISGSLRESAYKNNLEALGINFSFPGVNVPPAVEFSNSDARLSMTEDLFDWHAIQNTRSAGATARAAVYNYQSARDTVTLAVAAAYLLVISAKSQVNSASAELRTAEALHRLAEDRESAGLAPEIDTLRAKVELQMRRQSLIQAQNNLAKQRISLLRTIGLPVGQKIRLTTRVPYQPLPPVNEAAALKAALAARPDYLAAQQQVKAARLRLKSAEAERLPSVGISGDYGALGTHPDNAFSTWSVSAGMRIPIFEGGRIEADIRQAQAALAQRKAQRDDLRGRIAQEIEDALLDVSSASQQVEVARTTLDYARQALTEARDRFSAGVTNNIEVIQAQEALAAAEQQYIASLFAHNIAKVLFARARGNAEQSVKLALAEMSASSGASPAMPGVPAPAPAAPANNGLSAAPANNGLSPSTAVPVRKASPATAQPQR